MATTAEKVKPIDTPPAVEQAKEAIATVKDAVKAQATEEMIPKAKLDDALSRITQYEKTISALEKAVDSGRVSQSQANQAGNRILNQLDTVVDNVSSQLGGADKGEVRQWVNFLNIVLGELTRPWVGALAQLADRYDLLDTRTDIQDYKDFHDEVEKERESRAARGEYLSRKEGYHLVRSRRLPELLEAERKKLREEQQKENAESQISASAGEDLTSTQKAGPSPTKEPTKLTKEEFSRLPLDEQEKMLENVAI